MFLMGCSKNGVAAKEVERQVGVTYKCAWRMCHQIRELMGEELPYMFGTVEVDETYIGGKRPGKRGRGAAGKTAIVAALERGGNVLPVVVENTTAATVEAVIALAADKSAKINTDEYGAYNGLEAAGYSHDTVNHGSEQWTKGDVHTQNIEGFWSADETERSTGRTTMFLRSICRRMRMNLRSVSIAVALRRRCFPIWFPSWA